MKPLLALGDFQCIPPRSRYGVRTRMDDSFRAFPTPALTLEARLLAVLGGRVAKRRGGQWCPRAVFGFVGCILLERIGNGGRLPPPHLFPPSVLSGCDLGGWDLVVEVGRPTVPGRLHCGPFSSPARTSSLSSLTAKR